MSGSDIERADQRCRVGRKQLDAIALLWLRRSAVSPHVERDYLESLRERRHLRRPVARAGSESVNQQYRFARAVNLVIQVDAVGLNGRHESDLRAVIRPVRGTEYAFQSF